jgi:hypothetical protein
MVEYLEFSSGVRDILKHNGEITIIKNKVISLLWALKYAPPDGAIAEFGCYKGGNGYMLAKMRPNQQVFLFDTFEGSPDIAVPDIDDHKGGEYNDVDFAKVQETFKEFDNITLMKGTFKESLAEHKNTLFSLAFIDADLYQSTRDVLSVVKRQMITGGIIVLDDYSQPDCRGVKKAVLEELPLTELILLQNGSLAAWQNLGEVSCQSPEEPESDSPSS